MPHSTVGYSKALTTQLRCSPITDDETHDCCEIAFGAVADGQALAVDAEGCGLLRDP